MFLIHVVHAWSIELERGGAPSSARCLLQLLGRVSGWRGVPGTASLFLPRIGQRSWLWGISPLVNHCCAAHTALLASPHHLQPTPCPSKQRRRPTGPQLPAAV